MMSERCVARHENVCIRRKGLCSRPPGNRQEASGGAFKGTFRAECLNAHWFLTLADAVEKLEAWGWILQ